VEMDAAKGSSKVTVTKTRGGTFAFTLTERRGSEHCGGYFVRCSV
jgi:hypothetical protein